MRKKKGLQSDLKGRQGETRDSASGGITRRNFLAKVGLSALFFSLMGQIWIYLRALVPIPSVLYERPRKFKVGKAENFAEGGTFLPANRVFVFRDKTSFYCISAVCTHLGCTVQMVNLAKPKTVRVGGKELTELWEFHCPCHGSKFYGDGTNSAGPAPKPLPWLALEVAPDDGQLVVNAGRTVEKGWKLTV